MRADMESAPTIELLRLDWVGWQNAGGYGIRPYNWVSQIRPAIDSITDEHSSPLRYGNIACDVVT